MEALTNYSGRDLKEFIDTEAMKEGVDPDQMVGIFLTQRDLSILGVSTFMHFAEHVLELTPANAKLIDSLVARLKKAANDASLGKEEVMS